MTITDKDREDYYNRSSKEHNEKIIVWSVGLLICIIFWILVYKGVAMLATKLWFGV